jgi:hypothetical protein
LVCCIQTRRACKSRSHLPYAPANSLVRPSNSAVTPNLSAQRPDYYNDLHWTATTNISFCSLGDGRSSPRLPSFELLLTPIMRDTHRCRLHGRHTIFNHTLTSCSPPTRVSALRVVFKPCTLVSAGQRLSKPTRSCYTVSPTRGHLYRTNSRSRLRWTCKKPKYTKQNARPNKRLRALLKARSDAREKLH